MAVDEKINFKNDHERELFAAVMLSENVRRFLLEDPVGRYLHHRAKALIAQAEIDALAIDPDGWRGWLYARRKLRVTRQRAELGRSFINWLAEAIVDGNNAEKELMDDQ